MPGEGVEPSCLAAAECSGALASACESPPRLPFRHPGNRPIVGLVSQVYYYLLNWLRNMQEPGLHKMFGVEAEDRLISAVDLLQQLMHQNPNAFVPESTGVRRVRVNAISMLPLSVRCEEQAYPVKHIAMEVDVWNEVSTSGAPRVVDYRAPDHPGVQSVEYPVVFSRGSASLVFTRSEMAGNVSVSLKISKNLDSR